MKTNYDYARTTAIYTRATFYLLAAVVALVIAGGVFLTIQVSSALNQMNNELNNSNQYDNSGDPTITQVPDNPNGNGMSDS